jgi:hypothetical protein
VHCAKITSTGSCYISKNIEDITNTGIVTANLQIHVVSGVKSQRSHEGNLEELSLSSVMIREILRLSGSQLVHARSMTMSSIESL